MRKENFTFLVDDNRLEGTKYLSTDGAQPKVLSLHGGGNSNRARISYLLSELAQEGISSVTLDFSGHGDSSGELHTSSLALRARQATKLCELVDSSIDVIIGSSMGAHVASALLPVIKPRGLALFCPAAYAREAETVEFDQRFTAILRTENSYLSSIAFECIRAFDGRVAIFIGEDDKVIPDGVVNAYEAAAAPDKLVLKKFPGVGHQIHQWLEENPQARKEVIQTIAQML